MNAPFVNFGKIRRVMLLGGGRLLVEFAMHLQQKGFEVVAITSKRHAQGQPEDQGLALRPALEEAGIGVHVSDDVGRDQIVLEAIDDGTLAISFAAAWIFRKDFIERFDGRLLNIHGSRLPQNRGGGFHSWPILRSNRLGFSVLHQVDAGIDTGPIVKLHQFYYPAGCRVPRDYIEAYNQQNCTLLDEFLAEVQEEIDFPLLPQSEYFSSYWPRLSAFHHGYIDWNWSLRHIEQFICAFDEPYLGASTFVGEQRVFLHDCLADYNDGGFHPFQTGLIYRTTSDALYVAAGEGSLILRDVRDESGQSVLGKMKVGDRFFTPTAYLEQAKMFRAIYTPEGLQH